MSILEMKSKLDALFDVVNQETAKLEFDPKNYKSIYAVANHCTCLESANSILSLIGVEGSATTIPQIARGMLEAFANQQNIIKYDGYVESLAIDFLHMQKIICEKCIETEEAEDDKNPFLEEVLDSKTDWTARLSELETAIEQCKQAGGKRIPVWEKFKMASMSHEYVAVYKILCSHSHHSISELEHRHLIVEKGQGVSIKFMELPTVDQLNHILDLTSQIIVLSLKNLNELAVEGAIDSAKIDGALECFRKTLTATDRVRLD